MTDDGSLLMKFFKHRTGPDELDGYLTGQTENIG